ncbi:alpha/beta fold hydrolase [Oceanobacillus sojae]|uniref:alpha/beta fold hydrolase n=1 Tax=Oceanobacillus sojae TaxID=582851 RepID=UPI0021A3814E|nr:alpha/beta fold hydrolase [Oceanobacillus sojae]MCT1902796.1 alpha/beta hydrolase [Oceanobacillus sojae]
MSKKIAGFVLSIVIVFGIAVGFYFYQQNQTQAEEYTGAPTIFIHGYKGTEKSFGYMLDRFENTYQWGNKGFVYYVQKDGNIIDYNLNKGRYAPTFVQIVLGDNRASFQDSTEWVANVLLHLKENYRVEEVNLVGHSMGGILAVKYTMEYPLNGYPTVNKLVAIGSPFDGIYNEAYFELHQDEAANDLKPDSRALNVLRENMFPADVNVYSIASTGDTVAVPESVKTLRNMIPEQNYKETIIDDPQLTHSAMHESQQIDKLIYSFLWQD